MNRTTRVVAVVLALIAPLLVSMQPAESASAANAAQFDPGYIISDEMFYAGEAMTASQVQDFLSQKVTKCDSGYTCLVNYRQDTPNMAASAYCDAYVGVANESAAEIIAKVGKACNISQKALIVLIQKEQALVTMTNPSAGRFAHATGFSCPDTAPCDPAFAGFFYQVYYAARQFQIYAMYPTSWNYQAARTNYILYHPNAACGSSAVYIRNKATAGLYIYTPYQPNAAALANLYGTGDACSSYGNRNFWRIFTDWFGSPTVASSLVRTVSNSTVFLVSGDYKYPVPGLSLLAELSPLGPVVYVSQKYLDGFSTKQTAGHALRAPDGTIYFYGAGIKLAFTSCGQVVDYGASCESDGYVQLTAAQVAAFATGPAMGPVLGTVEGSRYYIKGGTKAEILDDASQASAGIPAGMNVLTENSVAYLPLTAPVIRDSAFVVTRSTSEYSLLSGGSVHKVPSGMAQSLGVPSRTSGSLQAASLALLPASPDAFEGVVRPSGSSGVSVVSAGGQYALNGGGLASGVVPIPMTQATLDTYPVKGTLQSGSFIKSPDKADVYVVMPKDIRPISGWDALLALTPDGKPVITTVPSSVIDVLAKGPVALTAGSLVRSPENATVYFVNGVTDLVPLSSFVFPLEAGFTSFTFSTEERINAYPKAQQLMSFGLSCGTSKYVAAGGQVHLVASELEALYPFTYVPMDGFTCAQLKRGVDASSFIRTPDGTIYQLKAGQKLPVASMQRLAQIIGDQSWLNVVPLFAAAIPTGPYA